MLQRLNREQWLGLLVGAALAAHFLLYRWGPHGGHPPEWPLLADLFITFPLAYALLCRPHWKQFLKRWAKWLMLGLAVGSYAIPEASKQVWQVLDQFRLVLPALAVVAELGLMAWLFLSLRRALRSDPYTDRLLAKAFQRFGDGAAARLLAFEARTLFYGLLMRKAPAYEGEQHFHTAKAGGNASNQLAWMAVIAFDIPIAHLLLHYIWSPAAAWWATGLTIWGLVYMLADYRATLVRPVSLGAAALHVRCGVLAADALVPYDAIEAVERVPPPARRLKEKRYFRHQGEMNVELRLRAGATLPTLLGGEKAATHAVLGVDDPAAFVTALAARLAQHNPPRP